MDVDVVDEEDVRLRTLFCLSNRQMETLPSVQARSFHLLKLVHSTQSSPSPALLGSVSYQFVKFV